MGKPVDFIRRGQTRPTVAGVRLARLENMVSTSCRLTDQ